MVRRLPFVIFSPLQEINSCSPLAGSIILSGSPVGIPEKRGSPMVKANASSAAPDGSDLLIAKRKIVAARTRAEQESDVTGGRSDGND